VLHSENHSEVAKQYITPLLDYLNGESEDALWSAYEFGRSAMAIELGPSDIVALHQEALLPIIRHAITTKEAAWIMERATKFFVESLSIFEMILRGYKETRDPKAQSAKLEYQAIHDALTGLPNRTLLYDRLRQAILIGRRENKPLSLFIMNFDHFEEVNDTLGRHHGDLLLKEIGMRLWVTLRESDTIARLAGDEFAVLLPSVNLEGATQSAQKVLMMMEKPFALEGMNLRVGASIGVAIFPTHGANPENLIQQANKAMYAAKQIGNGYVVYNPEKSAY
jgi:diguanylate cyclase (GGDEF)-like protein